MSHSINGDKTGKSVVTYCPGGSFGFAAARRPEKPREMIAILFLRASVRMFRTDQT
jgi:hypothetical protein